MDYIFPRGLMLAEPNVQEGVYPTLDHSGQVEKPDVPHSPVVTSGHQDMVSKPAQKLRGLDGCPMEV